MKKKVYFASKQKQIDPDKQKEKVDQINKNLVELRRNFLWHTNNNPKLKIKFAHFNKLIKSKVKDDDRVNFISYHLFTDKIEKK